MLDKLKKWFQQFTDPIIERVTAPFGITFIIVWSIHNWKVIFSIMNFDTPDLRQDKINIITAYNNSGEFLGLSNDFIWIPLWWSFGALFCYYLLSTLSLAIVTLYERWMRPFVFNTLNKNKIVSKEINIWLRDRVKLLLIENSEYQNQNEAIKRESDELKSKINQLENDNYSLQKERDKFEYFVGLMSNPNYTLFSDNELWKEELVEIKNKYPLSSWIQLLNNIKNHVENGNRYDTGVVNGFLSKELIKKVKKSGKTYFRFTRKGEEFIKMLFNEKRLGDLL